MRAWHVEAPGPVTGHPLRLHPDDEMADALAFRLVHGDITHG
jgi:hypothetical protein